MKANNTLILALAAGSFCLALTSCKEAKGDAASASTGHDWPQWGGHDTRNMVSDEKGMPTTFNPGKKKAGSEEIDIIDTQDGHLVGQVRTTAADEKPR